jgi:hypothetical protein
MSEITVKELEKALNYRLSVLTERRRKVAASGAAYAELYHKFINGQIVEVENMLAAIEDGDTNHITMLV